MARLRGLEGDYAGALKLASKAAEIAQSLVANGEQAAYLRFRIDHARTKCLAGDLDSVENAWREILSEQNEWTLASLMSNWLPCKRLMLATENYRRLQDEFGHLSNGVSVLREQ